MTNALTRRLRVDEVSGALGANYTAGDLTIDLGAALPSAAVPDGASTYLPIIVDGSAENIVWITDDAVSGHLYPCLGGKEGISDSNASSGSSWRHGPTVEDFHGIRRLLGPFHVTHATTDIATGVPLFTPAVGDVILNAFFVVNTLWNADGTVDFGTFLDAGDSYATTFSTAMSASGTADSGTDLSMNTSNFGGGTDLSAVIGYNGIRTATVALNAVPFCVKVAGTASAGDIDIYVEVATPVLSY